jgi:hypothetical protein
MAFIPLDVITQDAGGARLPGLSGPLPSYAQTNRALNQIMRPGPGPTNPTAQAREIEQSFATGLATVFAGFASEKGASDAALAAAGAGAIAYGVMNGHPVLSAIGRGLMAPFLFQLGKRAAAADPPARPVATAGAGFDSDTRRAAAA